MSAPRLYVPLMSVGAERIALPAEEAHHVTRVLRLMPGDSVRIFDGKGREWTGVLDSGPIRGSAAVIVHEELAPAAEPIIPVTLGIGVLKGDQMDAVVRDATALGVVEIAPMVTAHVTVPPRAWKSGTAVDRWQRVAVAAAKQCGRAVVPTVRPVASLADVLATRFDTIWLCAEPMIGAGRASGAGDDLPGSSALVLIGPEGGWSAGEVDHIRGAGAKFLNLGPRTLRAELAPVVALTSLWTRWGW